MTTYQTVRELAASKGHHSAFKFAKETRITYKSAKDYFRDPRRIPQTETINLICQAYGCQPGDFIHYGEVKDAVAA